MSATTTIWTEKAFLDHCGRVLPADEISHTKALILWAKGLGLTCVFESRKRGPVFAPDLSRGVGRSSGFELWCPPRRGVSRAYVRINAATIGRWERFREPELKAEFETQLRALPNLVLGEAGVKGAPKIYLNELDFKRLEDFLDWTLLRSTWLV